MSTPRACFVPKQLNVTPNREVHRATQLRDFVRKVIWGTLQYPIVSQLVHGRTTTQRDQETTFSFVWKWKDQHSIVFACWFPASCVKLLKSLRVKTVDFLCTAHVSGTRLALSAWKRASFLTCAPQPSSARVGELTQYTTPIYPMPRIDTVGNDCQNLWTTLQRNMTQ